MGRPPTQNRGCAQPGHRGQGDNFNPALTHKLCPDDLIPFVVIAVDEDIALRYLDQLLQCR